MPENENVETMEDVFDEIGDLSDEEIQKKTAEESKLKKDDETSGDVNEDRMTEDEAKAMMEDTNDGEGEATPSPATPATGGTAQPDLEAKVSELEAELKKERQRTGSWDGRIKAANDKVKNLEAENAQLKEDLEKSKTAVTDESANSEAEVMKNFQETFPELVEVLDIYKKNIDKKYGNVTPAKVEPEVETKPEPKPTEESDVDTSKHFDEIQKVHPDLSEAVSTGVLQTWINKQDDFIKPHLQSVYDGGTSKQVISLMTNFKTKSGWTSQLDTGKDKDTKLRSMLETEGESPGPKTDGPDKDDFAGTAKEIGL